MTPPGSSPIDIRRTATLKKSEFGPSSGKYEVKMMVHSQTITTLVRERIKLVRGVVMSDQG